MRIMLAALDIVAGPPGEVGDDSAGGTRTVVDVHRVAQRAGLMSGRYPVWSGACGKLSKTAFDYHTFLLVSSSFSRGSASSAMP